MSGIVVTGGASGIGAAVVRRLLDDGVPVAALDLGSDDLDLSPADVRLACDVTRPDAVEPAFARAARALGGLHGLVTCAGIVRGGDIVESSIEDWQAIFDVNVMGVVNCCRAAMPFLVAEDHASVVLIGSQLAITPEQGVPAYAASKGAILSLARAMALDHIGDGVRTNVVCPGPTDTEMNQRFFASQADPEATRREVEMSMPHQRMIDPAEIADAVAYLLSPGSRSTVGATLVVDGGYTIR